MSELLQNGGRLGVTALDIKRFKEKALNDEMLLNKEAGLLYYKNKDGDILSIDLINRVSAVKNMIDQQMAKNLIVDYDIYQLNALPQKISATSTAICNPDGLEENYEEFILDVKNAHNYAISIVLDMVRLNKLYDEEVNFMANDIFSSQYTAKLSLSDSSNFSLGGVLNLIGTKFGKISDMFGEVGLSSTGKLIMKNLNITHSQSPIVPGKTDPIYYLFGAYAIIVPINK